MVLWLDLLIYKYNNYSWMNLITLHATVHTQLELCTHHSLSAEREEDVSPEVQGGDLLCAAPCRGILSKQLPPGGHQLERLVCVPELQL